jgi:hypothetical protein
MTSADFSDLFSLPHDNDTPPLRGVSEISPGNALTPSHLYLPHLQPCPPGKYWISEIFASLSVMIASYVIPVRQVSALPSASFRFSLLGCLPAHLAIDTLAVQLTIPLTGLVGDLHSQVSAPCRAHKIKQNFTEISIINNIMIGGGSCHKQL